MISLTKREAIKIIESTNREYERFLCNLNRRYHTKPERLSLEAAVLAQQYDDVYRCVNSSLWRFYKNTKSGDLKAILDEYLILCRNFNFRTLQSFPKEEFMVSEAEDKMPEAIDAALEKLEGYGDEQIQKAVRQCREGKRIIEFSSMDERQNGQTYRVNDFYSHYITDRFKENTIENQVRLAVTLAHELKRNAATDSLEAETQEIVLSDTKIIESFSGTYGEEIYKKFPEYGILHYIKKIFGETELKEFADYAFDSTGSYWKVNEAGDLADDGNASRVADAKGKELHSGTKGLQGTLQEWLGMENAYAALMQPAGFEWNGKKWSKNPGKIDHSVIEKAHNDGQLTEDQYNKIQLAACLITAENEEVKRFSLFQHTLEDFHLYNQTKTKIQNEIIILAWNWLKKEYNKIVGNRQVQNEVLGINPNNNSIFFSTINSKEVQDKVKEWNEIDKKNKLEFNKKEEEKYQEAKKNKTAYNKKNYKPISRCDEYSTLVLKKAGLLPDNWPDPETTKVNEYWSILSSKLKDKPEKGWNVMLMRSVDSKGNLIGYAPHMAVIFVNDNNSISLAHYTGGKEMKSDDWSQKGIENDGSDSRGGFRYSSFLYYPIKEKKK